MKKLMLLLLCGGCASAPTVKFPIIPIGPPMPPTPNVRTVTKQVPVSASFVMAQQAALLSATFPLAVTSTTNGGHVHVFLLPVDNTPVPLAHAPLKTKAKASIAVTGPRWYDAFPLDYFPPDPFAGHYFQADCDQISPGLAEIQLSEDSINWKTVYKIQWDGTIDSLGITLVRDLPVKEIKLKLTP